MEDKIREAARTLIGHYLPDPLSADDEEVALYVGLANAAAAEAVRRVALECAVVAGQVPHLDIATVLMAVSRRLTEPTVPVKGGDADAVHNGRVFLEATPPRGEAGAAPTTSDDAIHALDPLQETCPHCGTYCHGKSVFCTPPIAGAAPTTEPVYVCWTSDSTQAKEYIVWARAEIARLRAWKDLACNVLTDNQLDFKPAIGPTLRQRLAEIRCGRCERW